MLSKFERMAKRAVARARQAPSTPPESPVGIATRRDSFAGLMPPGRHGTVDAEGSGFESSNATLRSPDPKRNGSSGSRAIQSEAHPDGPPVRLTAHHQRYLQQQFNVDVGHASGEGLNCLLESFLQLFHNRRIERGQDTPEGIRTIAPILRDILIEMGAASENTFIDVYGGAAQYLADTYRVRIQIVELRARAPVLHPIIGDEGLPLLQILHTVNHFQPLWPLSRDQ